MGKSPITAESRVVRSKECVTAEVDDDLVMISLETNNYYSLDSIGRTIWSHLSEPIRVSDLCGRLVTEFDVEPARCLRDVLDFLSDLERQGLVEAVT